MIDLPIADCFKELYVQRNAAFTDYERATIFWNSMLPLSEKLEALRKIHSTTTDEELKAQIQARLNYEAEMEQAFMNPGSDYVYMVILDETKEVARVFTAVDAAIIYGKDACDQTFRIDKEMLDDLSEPDSEDDVLLGGYAAFRKDGTLMDLCCYSSGEADVTILNAIEPEGFEEAYISLLNPFEYGDVVRIMGDDRPAIVITQPQKHNALIERHKQAKFPLNYYSNAITVEFLYPNGEFSHGHPDMLHLERIDHWEDEHEWKLLQAVSNLMKGTGNIESVIRAYRANKYHHA